VHAVFRRLVSLAQLRVEDGRAPTLHGLRHRFATGTLVRWYRAQLDPERKLPILSAYLGPVHVADTQWYVSGSPALMREAMRRLEQRWEERP
jgi:integrase